MSPLARRKGIRTARGSLFERFGPMRTRAPGTQKVRIGRGSFYDVVPTPREGGICLLSDSSPPVTPRTHTPMVYGQDAQRPSQRRRRIARVNATAGRRRPSRWFRLGACPALPPNRMCCAAHAVAAEANARNLHHLRENTADCIARVGNADERYIIRTTTKISLAFPEGCTLQQ
eukprot:gene12736-biopygen3461